MEELNFKPQKSKESFHANYSLHDVAAKVGCNLLVQWGIEFANFGEDKRYQKVWEQGKDKPDLIITLQNKKALLDWKGKKKNFKWINKRAAEAYLEWSSKMNLPVVICFFTFDEKNLLLSRQFAILPHHKFNDVANKAWDGNEIVSFDEELPEFTKSNLLKHLTDNE